MEKVYILTHTDLDGYISAGLIEHYYKQANWNNDVLFTRKPWTYGRELPDINKIVNNFNIVYVVDVCPDAEYMFKLYEHFRDNLIWIDHHVNKDNKLHDAFKLKYPNNNISGIRADYEHSTSAAMLVYKYFDDIKYNKQDIPEWIQYISDYDCWNRNNELIWQNKIMPYVTYLKSIVSSPMQGVSYVKDRYENNTFYDTILSTDDMIFISDIQAENGQTLSEIESGKLMYKELISIYNTEAKHGFARALRVKTENDEITLTAWICNTQNRSSILFENIENQNNYDVYIAYHYDGELYRYSMYTKKSEIHCNDIIIITDKQDLYFNGHTDAAGATSDKFIF